MPNLKGSLCEQIRLKQNEHKVDKINEIKDSVEAHVAKATINLAEKLGTYKNLEFKQIFSEFAEQVNGIIENYKVVSKQFGNITKNRVGKILQNILKGYQCGTVYKPIYLEAQAAAALALYLRAGVTPPSSLVNATTKDTKIGKDIKSVYTTPIWVTTDNMADTVVKDGAVKVSDLCGGSMASACSAAGIS